MKINCGPTKDEREEAARQWHDWFAWFPVRVGSKDCRWLEGVQRRRQVMREYFDDKGNLECATFWGSGWDYRSKA